MIHDFEPLFFFWIQEVEGNYEGLLLEPKRTYLNRTLPLNRTLKQGMSKNDLRVSNVYCLRS